MLNTQIVKFNRTNTNCLEYLKERLSESAQVRFARLNIVLRNPSEFRYVSIFFSIAKGKVEGELMILKHDYFCEARY